MPKERNKAACNYGFTVDNLKERKGLKQFFGFKDSIKLIRLSEEHTIAFKEEMQEAFQHGFMAYYKDDTQWQVLIGQTIWKAIEAMHPEIEVWETCTPYFDRRNIHFYINRCGFHAVEFFNEHHPDPNMPRQPNEQREQSDVNIGYAESRERKSEAQFDQEDGLFKFEKRMR